MFNTKLSLILWYLAIFWVTYHFLWGNAAEKAFDLVSSKKFTIEDKRKAIIFGKVFAVIFFLFNTIILILALSDMM